MSSGPIQSYYQSLLAASQKVAEAAFQDETSLSKAHASQLGDLFAWQDALSNHPESAVLKYATVEFQLGMFALTTGLYRHAFASLRLSLELSLLAVHFSTNRLELAEWRSNAYDNKWALLTGEDGVLSARYARAFFPELAPQAADHCRRAKVLYRSLSEFVHGNQPTWELTPDNLRFDKALHEGWFDKACEAIDVVTFALVLRFSRELPPAAKEALSPAMMERFGHDAVIRVEFGGVATNE